MSNGEGLALLLKVTAYDTGQIDQLDVGPMPGGEIDDTAFTLYWAAVATTTYPAATVGRTTAPSDTPANTFVSGVLGAAMNYGIKVISAVDPLSTGRAATDSISSGSSTVGVLNIMDPSGDLDAEVRRVWDGATVEILRGDPAAAFSTYSSVATLTSAGMVYDADIKEIRLRDLGWMLSAPLHGQLYAGTGLIEGDTILANTVKPILFGSGATNITPKQINATALIYQISYTSIQAITAVRDGGVVLTPGADYATYALLAAATVAAGTYATSLALGLFRLGGKPDKGVTVDAQGDNESIGGATYVSTRAAIAKRIAIGRGDVKFTTAQLDAASFTRMDTGQPGACGWYFDQEISKADALAIVMAGCLGYWFVSIAGLLTVDYIYDLPTTADFTLTVPALGQAAGTYDITGDPQMQDYGAPRRATHLGWARNYTVQEPGVLATSVTAANAAIWGAASRWVISVNTPLKLAQPTAPLVRTDSGFALEADAQTECTRQQTVLGTRRELWAIKVRMDPFANLIGQAANVLGWSRFYFTGGRILRVVGIDVSGRNDVTITLWG